jgi:hypothetical protein
MVTVVSHWLKPGQIDWKRLASGSNLWVTLWPWG